MAGSGCFEGLNYCSSIAIGIWRNGIKNMPRFKTVHVILSTGFYMISFLLVVKENIAFIYVQYRRQW